VDNTANVPSGSPIDSDAARSEWLKTGTFPTPTADQSADPAPAEPAEQAASTDAHHEGDSEPPKPAKEKGDALRARNSDLQAEIERNAELLRLRAEQRKQLREVPAEIPQKTDARPASSPAADLTKAEYTRYREMPDAPKIGDFQEIEDYTAAMALFIGRHEADATFDRKFSEISKQATDHQERLRDVNARVIKADAAYKAYLEKTPDAETKINPHLVEIIPASLLPDPREAKPHNVLADFVMDSGCPGQLHEYFSTPEGTKHWQSLLQTAHRNPRAVAFDIGKLAARFDAVPVAPSPKTISTAPEPVETLGKRPAAPTDDAQASLAAGDFEGYSRAMNARDWAARGTA
jgi:hypothetical protein